MTNDELPEGWMETAFEELNTFKSQTIDPSAYPDEVFELYSVPTFPTRKPELLAGSAIGSTKQIVEPGDVLVCKINPRINRVWKVMPKTDRRQIASSEWIVMRAKGVNSEFLRTYFSSEAFREILCEDLTGVGGSLTRAQPKRVAKFGVPIAPIAEQKRIADKLEAVLGRVDACRARLDRVPDLLKRFRQSVLAAATSGQLTEDWRKTMKLESPAITSGRKLASNCLPDGWKVVELASVVQNHDNRRVPIKSSDRKRRAGAFPYYGAFGVIDSIDGFLFDGEFVLLAEDGKNLESRDRPIALIATGKFWVNNHAHVLQPKNVLAIGYLGHSLNAPTLEIDSLLTGIDQIKLTRAAMDRIELNLPPLPEQQEIVHRVEALFALADRIEARLSEARAQVERLTPATLAKAFRGELVPQDPNDEPAAALLERIRTESASANVRSPRRK